ncbi:MAG: CHAT domain-containing protein [Oscillibacter sp.]|nr:CHAT domain-containing protein [Oscillibacter sp.]
MRLTIQHMGTGPEEPLFRLNLADNPTEPVLLPNPAEYPVKGYDGGLMTHLQWYLEDYLSLPEGGSGQRAEATVSALEAWGTAVFDALFDRNAYLWYRQNLRALEDLQIRIISSSPTVLAWPWEALCDNQRPGARTGSFLAPHCCMERQPDAFVPPETPAGEAEELRMLLVIARPYGDRDVGYHAVAREVVDCVRENRLPVSIDALRPPTFENLRETLESAKKENRPYHIVHFDGHGGYGDSDAEKRQNADGEQRRKFRGAEGSLLFETLPESGEDPEPHAVGAKDLGQMLYQCGVRMAVLNACQSAMIDGRADDAYASVAASLLNAGIPSVTAMGYSLYVAGAQQFVPAFYKELFRRGAPADAMRAGRNAMYIHKERFSLAGETPLQDWLVPELYQKLPAGAEVLPRVPRKAPQAPEYPVWPPDALDPDEYGFIGRGDAIQELERLLRRRTAAGILIHGMAGAGKTALTKGFLSWLRDTGGLRDEYGTPCPVFWFDFRDIHSGEHIVSELAARLLKDGASLKPDEKFRRVIKYLRENQTFVVWDNFESASGAPGTPPNLAPDGLDYLKTILKKLDGGKSRIFLTSRTTENWLGQAVTPVRGDLGGLPNDELWKYVGRIGERLNIRIDRKNKALGELLAKLDGNPLAVRAVVSRMGEYSPKTLLAELDEAFIGLEGDESTTRIRAAFNVLMKGADAEMSSVLQTLGLHEHFADADWVESILYNVEGVKANTQEALIIGERVTRCWKGRDCALIWGETSIAFIRLCADAWRRRTRP